MNVASAIGILGGNAALLTGLGSSVLTWFLSGNPFRDIVLVISCILSIWAWTETRSDWVAGVMAGLLVFFAGLGLTAVTGVGATLISIYVRAGQTIGI